jgi:hypothetical protein
MEKITPISIKNILIVSDVGQNEYKQKELNSLVKITTPDLIIGINNDFYKGDIPYYCNLKNNYLNFENQINIFNYESQENLSKSNEFDYSNFSICVVKDIKTDCNQKWNWNLILQTDICLINDNKMDYLISKENTTIFTQNNIQFLITNQIRELKQLCYYSIRIEFYEKKISYNTHHSHEWMFNFFKKNDQNITNNSNIIF